jgi:hypothetical protein
VARTKRAHAVTAPETLNTYSILSLSLSPPDGNERGGSDEHLPQRRAKVRRRLDPLAGIACGYGLRATPSSGSRRRSLRHDRERTCGRPRDGSNGASPKPTRRQAPAPTSGRGSKTTAWCGGQRGGSGPSPSTPARLRGWVQRRRDQRRREARKVSIHHDLVL